MPLAVVFGGMAGLAAAWLTPNGRLALQPR
jgi:hypothetical protein